MGKFLEELKRRNVPKSALAYLIVAWVLIQVFTTLLPIVDAPEWVLKALTLLLAIGLPIWIVVSWIYNLSPEGITKTTRAADDGWSKRVIVVRPAQHTGNGWIITHHLRPAACLRNTGLQAMDGS